MNNIFRKVQFFSAHVKSSSIMIIVLLFVVLNISFKAPSPIFTIATGHQPQISMDKLGVIRIIYGDSDKIYCATSLDNGATFPDIQKIGEIKDMHLGNSRGPQVASSINYTLVSAMDKKGAIHTFQLAHQSGKWTKVAFVNDVSGTALEGLMGIASDNYDNFYAVWLDLRDDKNNKICFSKTTNQGKSWSENKIVYKSPYKTVCECCKPSIVVSQSKVFIMFRNLLNGSRDLHLLQSDDLGINFNKPVKLGNGTWKLNGCPMDGGGLVVNSNNEVETIWQREGLVYFSKLNEEETQIGLGRNCSISDAEKPILSWQDGKKLKVKDTNQNDVFEIGEGSSIKTIRATDNKVLCAWEKEGKIFVNRL